MTSLSRMASDAALSTLCGSSMMTLSPLMPVRLVMAVAILKPVALFTKFSFSFWSLASFTRSPHRS